MSIFLILEDKKIIEKDKEIKKKETREIREKKMVDLLTDISILWTTPKSMLVNVTIPNYNENCISFILFVGFLFVCLLLFFNLLIFIVFIFIILVIHF